LSHLRIAIDSSLEEVFLVSLVIRAVCSHLGLDEIQTAEVELCAVEAATNAIKHAYRGKPGRDVAVALSFTDQQLDLEVRDEGFSMPPEQRERLRTGSAVLAFEPSDLANVPEGGMGLEIIRRTMDRVEYSTGGGTNQLRLTKFIGKAARA
jgi:serine/threonine-protein kinase RsbW